MNKIAGISGGRTSGMMAHGLAPDVVLCFQNTGLEREETLVFLRRLEDWIARKIVWIEWRPPQETGGAPRSFRAEVVTFDTAHRGPDLMLGMLRACAAYRKANGKTGASVPWARQRLCTAYLKHRTMERWVESLGWDAFDQFVGLRADEPRRVSGLRASQTTKKTFSFPLFDSGVTVNDVSNFWRSAPFDLGLDPHEGNCTGCFLKDQADLSRLMVDPRNMPNAWLQIQKEFPGFGGRDNPTYAQHIEEFALRRRAELLIQSGADPMRLAHDRRSRLVILQEKRRFIGSRSSFSCSCESSMADSQDAGEQLLLDI